MSIDRHGINRGDVGPLAKSSFEETTDMLINASIFAEYDNVNGVSANVMLGQQPPCGTGDSQLLIDEEHLVELINTSTIKNNIDYINNDDISDDNNEICNSEDILFNYDIKKQNNKCTIFKESKILINE
jgi:DNA-directed RNA polymerase beta' subunit